MANSILIGIISALMSATGEWLLFEPTKYYPNAYLLYLSILYVIIGIFSGLLCNIVLNFLPSKILAPLHSKSLFIFSFTTSAFMVCIADKKLLSSNYFLNINNIFLLFLDCAFLVFLLTLIYNALRIILSSAILCWLSNLPYIAKIGFEVMVLFFLLIYSLSPRFSRFKQLNNSDKQLKNTSVILITIDTLRADYVSGYNPINSTPEISKFSRDAVIFKNCFSTSPWTVPSHASLFTSLMPSSHGADWIDKGKSKESTCLPLRDDANTIAEAFKKNNYITSAFIGNMNLSRSFGFAQGFDFYYDNPHPYFDGFILRPAFSKFVYERLNSDLLRKVIEDIDPLYIKIVNFIYLERFREFPLNYPNILMRSKKGADEVNNEFFHWINKNRSKPFFIFINYYDPHDPYLPHDGFLSDIIRNYKGRIDYKTYPLGYMCSFIKNPSTFSKSDLEYIKELYKGEVRFVDYNIGLLIDMLKNEGIYDDTLIIITSDHGEALGEHNFLTHDNFLYDELIHVPFIIKFPQKKYSGMVKSELGSLIDVMPSLLKFIGIRGIKGMEGFENMFEIDSSLNKNNKFVASEVSKTKKFIRCSDKFNRDLKSLRTLEWKFIKASNHEDELYAISKDPNELSNLKDENKNYFVFLNEMLENYFLDKKLTKKSEISDERKKEIENKLKALGYAQ